MNAPFRKGESIDRFLDRVIRRRARRIATGVLESGRRIDSLTVGKRGRYIRYRHREGDIQDIAIIPTLQRAAIRSRIVGEKVVVVDRSDLCEKIRRRKRPAFITIVLDASSSMSQHGGAYTTRKLIDSLLMDVYQNRDRVSVISVSGKDAEFLLPFTASVDRAREVISGTQFGGTTPLFHGMMRAIRILQDKVKGERECMPVMLVITDGGVNIPLRPVLSIEESLEEVASEVRELGMLTIVIDMSFGRSRIPEMIAGSCGGVCYMPEELEVQQRFVDPVELKMIREAIAIALVSPRCNAVLIRNMGEDAVQKIASEIENMALDIECVAGCPFGCGPDDPSTMCRGCYLKWVDSRIETTIRTMPIVRLDEVTSPDDILGRVFVRNLVTSSTLARANRGVLFLEDVSRVDPDAARVLLRVMRTGRFILTPPGTSTEVSFPSRFILIAYQPEGARIDPLLEPGFRICVDGAIITGPAHTLRRIRDQRVFEQDQEAFLKDLERGAKELMFSIIRARAAYARVDTPTPLLDLIVRICSEFLTAGNLAEVLIEDVARCMAALRGSSTVSEEDIISAAEYVLPVIRAGETPSGRVMSVEEAERSIRELVGDL